MLLSQNSPMSSAYTRSKSKMTIDEDEADLTVLENNLDTTDQSCEKISKQLDELAKTNSKAIQSMKPLMLKIKQMKLRQRNINYTTNVIDKVKEYASNIKSLDDVIGANGDLKTRNQIESYCNALSEYDNIHNTLVHRSLDGFTGLMTGLNASIKDAEVTLKYGLVSKLKKLSKIQSKSGGDPRNEIGLVKDIEFIYEYMKTERKKDLVSKIENERMKFCMNQLRTDGNVRLPNLVKDQNYLYGGASKGGSSSFTTYSAVAAKIIQRESKLLPKLVTSPTDSMAAVTHITANVISDVCKTANQFISFVSANKYAYCTLLYELGSGLKLLSDQLERSGVSPPQILNQVKRQTFKDGQLVFSQFFEFIDQRYGEMVISEHPNETLNNTFMMLVTRLSKFSLFKTEQLVEITPMTIGSWLPASKPHGFQDLTAQSKDPRYLLSTFYSDVIEYSFYSLADKFQPHMLEEDLGVMLLFNLDGLQNLLDSRTQLKNILGQQGINRVERLKKKAIDRATTEWSNMTTKLMEASTRQGDSFNMSNKEMGRFIDDFNKSFAENYRKLHDKNLPPFFKKELAQNIKKMVGPAYRVFYMSITRESSTKSAKKHFRYSISEFERQLTTLG